MSTRLRIAMLGSRGVPATFGGIEHHVEEIGRRLVDLGHDVTVFCEHDYVEAGSVASSGSGRYLGMELVMIPSVRSKHLEALAHSGRSTLQTLRRDRFDVVHYHAVGPGVFTFLPRWLGRAKVIQTIHGLDGQRAKWGRGARSMLRVATWLSARVPDATVVVSRELAEHYRAKYGRPTIYIPNGVSAPAPAPAALIGEQFGLEAGRYVLFVGRLVPEKCPDLLMRAFGRVRTEHSLVVAGGTSYTDDYVQGLEALAARDPRVLMPGYVYGPLRDELYANAAAFVLPSALEGLPLTLLEAIAAGTPVVASDIGPHLEVIGDSGPGAHLFPAGDELALAQVLQSVLADPRAEAQGAALRRADVLARYEWDAATAELEALYRRLVA